MSGSGDRGVSFCGSGYGMTQAKHVRARSVMSVVRRLWSHMGVHRPMYVGGFALSIVDAGCQASIPMIFRAVINALKDSPVRFMNDWFWPTVLGCAALAVVFFPAAFVHHLMIERSVIRMIRDLRNDLYEHVQHLSADFFQRNRVGEVTARLNNDMDVLGQASQATAPLLWQVVLVAQSLAMMLYINVPLTGLFAVLMVVVTVWGRHFIPRLRRLSRSVRDATGDVSAAVTEYVAINDLIKAFSREDFAQARVEQETDALRQKAEQFVWWQYVFGDVLQVLVRFIAPFALLLTGAYLLAGDGLEIGDLVAFWGYWLMMGGAMVWVFRSIATVFTATAAADRIFDFFDERPLIRDAVDAREVSGLDGDIRFESVTFNYPTESQEVVLNEVSFHISSGRTVAVVGPSGAGKSTILQLILRFYDPKAGRVLIDGQDVRQLRQASLRRHIGMVMQESVFFAGTIEENLRLARPDASAAEVRDALRHANALALVDQMPGGVQTVLGERGVRLSGGQKQRLSIARVFLKDPPILLFDEATSSLDSVAEKLVQAAMDELMKGRTTLVVAHRISTVQDADEILVIDRGRIIGVGTHPQLLESCPVYYSLCAHQQLGDAPSAGA